MKATQPISAKEALNKLQRYCAYRERCPKEVYEKMTMLNVPKNLQDTIITQLKTDNFLNEKRFAEIFVHDKFYLSQWGKYRIVQELKNRQIAEQLITHSLQQEIDETEYLKTFQLLLTKRLKTLHQLPLAEQKRKTIDYLLRKGFEAELVYESLQKIKS